MNGTTLMPPERLAGRYPGCGPPPGKSTWLAWGRASKPVPIAPLALRGGAGWEVVRMERERLSGARPERDRRKSLPARDKSYTDKVVVARLDTCGVRTPGSDVRPTSSVG